MPLGCVLGWAQETMYYMGSRSRLRYDLVFVYKMLFGLVDLKFSDYFTLTTSTTRGWRSPLSWIFNFFENFNGRTSQKRSNCVTVPNLVEIGQNAAEIWRLFDFSKWRPPPSWIFTFQIFNGRAAQRAELCRRAKFCRNRPKRG